MELKFISVSMSRAAYDSSGIEPNDKTNVEFSQDNNSVEIHRLLTADEDIQTVAAQEFPNASSFYQVTLDKFHFDTKFNFDTFALNAEGNIGQGYLVGTVEYDSVNDRFQHINSDSKEYALSTGDIVLNSETRVPYFTCPHTTAELGELRGDQIFSPAQLAELKTGRLTHSPRSLRLSAQPKPAG